MAFRVRWSCGCGAQQHLGAFSEEGAGTFEQAEVAGGATCLVVTELGHEEVEQERLLGKFQACASCASATRNGALRESPATAHLAPPCF